MTKQQKNSKYVANFVRAYLGGYKSILVIEDQSSFVEIPMIVQEVVPGIPPFTPFTSVPTRVMIRADVKLRTLALLGLKHTKPEVLGPFKGMGWREKMGKAIVDLVKLHADQPTAPIAIEGLEDKVVQFMRLLVQQVPLPTLEGLIERVPRQGPVYPLAQSEQVSRKLAATLLESWKAADPPCRSHLSSTLQ